MGLKITGIQLDSLRISCHSTNHEGDSAAAARQNCLCSCIGSDQNQKEIIVLISWHFVQIKTFS